MHLKMSFAKWRPISIGLYVLNRPEWFTSMRSGMKHQYVPFQIDPRFHFNETGTICILAA